MKIKICVLAFLFLVMQNILAQKSSNYKIVEIDSVNNYYFITVKKNFKKYLIISNKIRTEGDCEKIKHSKKYKLVLIKYVPAIIIPNRKNFSISIEDRVVWSDGGKYTAYTTDMLSGLCLTTRFKYCKIHENKK
ncbi:hypothetical protein [Flavobacterium circumlabens]|nr:hypothetical protein [Flavobacterium circumlabens]TCN60144.1 hypothetical protein EV142_102764 [Flavobacterium circumlabens]